MNINQISRLLNVSFLLIPFLLITVTVMLIGVYFPPPADSTQTASEALPLWKTMRTYILLYFASSIFFVRWYEIKQKTSINLSGKKWISGLLLVMLSYALSGFIIDLVYVGWYIQQT